MTLRFAITLLLSTSGAKGTPAPTNLIVEVEALSLTPTARPGPSLLKDIPGLSLRDQGTGGPQTDLSIRGSPFNSSGLLFNGLTLRNAQTEHWQADVPAPEVWFGTPIILTGLDRFRVAPGHPSGSISLDLFPLTEDLHTATAGVGNSGQLFGNTLLTSTTTLADGGKAGTSAFVAYDRANQTDGYPDNDLQRATAGGRVGAFSDTLQGDLITAISWREFGARGFYGTDTKYPAEEQVKDTMVAGSLKWTEKPLNPTRLTTAWRRTDDTYWLDRHDHDYYENDHTTDFFALHGDTRQTLTDALFIDLRADGDLETIHSTSLGDHTRSHASFATLPNYSVGALTFTLGTSLDLFTQDHPAWLPAAGIEWQISDIHALFLSYTEAVRQPSYTELNYESPSSLGNAGLERQQTRTAEFGWKGQTQRVTWHTTLFYEEGENIVDWIRSSPGSRWIAVNMNAIRTYGFAADGRVELTDDTDIGVDLLALAKTCDTDYYASRYAMDYPNAASGTTLRHRLTRDLLFRLRQGVSRYEDNPVRKNDDWFINTCLEFQYRLPYTQSFTLNVGADNLFADDFQVFPGQEPAGRRYFGSLTYTW